MRTLLFIVSCLLCMSPSGAQNGPSTVTGYLVDRDTVKKSHDKVNLELTRATYHRRNALQSQVGFAVVSNGRVYVLDVHGNKLAKLLIADSHNDQPLMVMLRGRLADGKVVVEQLSDVSVQQF